MYMAYDPGESQQTTPVGVLYVYMTPDQDYTVHLETDMYLSEFAAVTDNVTFEPVYYEAILYGLAVRLFRHFRKPSDMVPPDLAALAAGSLDTLRALNAVAIQASLDLPGKIGGYNIYVDGPNK